MAFHTGMLRATESEQTTAKKNRMAHREKIKYLPKRFGFCVDPQSSPEKLTDSLVIV